MRLLLLVLLALLLLLLVRVASFCKSRKHRHWICSPREQCWSVWFALAMLEELELLDLVKDESILSVARHLRVASYDWRFAICDLRGGGVFID